MRRIASSLWAPFCAALLSAFASSAGWADEEPRVQDADFSSTLKATGTARQPMNLLLTQSELRAVVRNYETRTGQDFSASIAEDEVLVTAPGVQAPMRDVSQDVGMGIFAPFWAIANPREAWRIFVPIPPKGQPSDSRPAPDPR